MTRVSTGGRAGLGSPRRARASGESEAVPAHTHVAVGAVLTCAFWRTATARRTGARNGR